MTPSRPAEARILAALALASAALVLALLVHYGGCGGRADAPPEPATALPSEPLAPGQ